MRRSVFEHVIRASGDIGEGSLFHEQNGYYAQGVGPETTVLPDGWQRGDSLAGAVKGEIDKAISRTGLGVAGWREVPVDTSVCGELALRSLHAAYGFEDD